ncbi:Protein EARLY FLOWERING 3 [Linum perenne]
MKRGKDEEKMMSPLFPRLHVNDTEKGGPRAPPRNKMALYEQLSIPSQRFNPAVLPRTPTQHSNLAPPGSSSSQASGLESKFSYPQQVTPIADQFPPYQSGAGNLNSSLAMHEQRKKTGEEDDFTVPIFVHTGVAPLQRTVSNNIDGQELATFSSKHSGHSNRAHNAGNNNAQCDSSVDPHLRLACISSGDNLVTSSMKLRARENLADSRETAIVQTKKGCQGTNLTDLNSSHGDKSCLQQKSNDCILGDAVPELQKGSAQNVIIVEKDLCPSEEPCRRNEDGVTYVARVDVSIGLRNADKSDDVSETSILDSAEPLDMSPDDVVEIIGQKHFWKARRAIVNQQRVFAVQVFELHRLIKVQQLIAGSPQLLVEDNNYLGKPSMPGSPMKKLQSEYVLVQAARTRKRKDDTEEPSNKLEGSAENAVAKPSLPSLRTGSQPSANHTPHVGNQVPAPAVNDSKTGAWCFHQPTGQQWLVPVMSPTEGLIYKPYAPPGSMGAGCGGCGSYGPAPIMGNFMNPGYGAAPYLHQGSGGLPGPPPVGHGCFPPYGMPVMSAGISGSAVEQRNRVPVSGSHGQNSQLSGSGANFSVQHQSSTNVELRTQKSGVISMAEIRASTKEREVQGSTASSRSERMEVVGSVQQVDGRDAAVYMFPARPPSVVSDPRDQGQTPRVIRVVPHNPRSATESAARIFQSIQEERKQQESI